MNINQEKINIGNSIESLPEDELESLSHFFDLLARFDYEDKRKLVLNSDALASAPRLSELDPNFLK